MTHSVRNRPAQMFRAPSKRRLQCLGRIGDLDDALGSQITQTLLCRGINPDPSGEDDGGYPVLTGQAEHSADRLAIQGLPINGPLPCQQQVGLFQPLTQSDDASQVINAGGKLRPENSCQGKGGAACRPGARAAGPVAQAEDRGQARHLAINPRDCRPEQSLLRSEDGCRAVGTREWIRHVTGHRDAHALEATASRPDLDPPDAGELGGYRFHLTSPLVQAAGAQRHEHPQAQVVGGRPTQTDEQ